VAAINRLRHGIARLSRQPQLPALPVMGVFEVVDGEIVKWSDYFDMATVTKAFT
jgi:limonene-1,2-epoxide hydrolase